MKTRSVLLGLAAVGMLSVKAVGGDSACQHCGQGNHWVDDCGTDNDTLNLTEALVGIDLDLDCIADTSVILRGPTTINRSDPLDDSANFPGTRPVDGHLDVIDTEIVSMSLTGGPGITLTAGAGLGQGGVLKPSLGAIGEQASENNLADSFFDVFFEVDLGGGNLVYNHTPLVIEAKIDCVPPDAEYIHPTGCVPLFDSPIQGTGVLVANLVSAVHKTFPQRPSEVPAVSTWGSVVLALTLLVGVGRMVYLKKNSTA